MCDQSEMLKLRQVLQFILPSVLRLGDAASQFRRPRDSAFESMDKFNNITIANVINKKMN